MAEMMEQLAPATIDVQYRFIDGYHVFTSDGVFGLYIASKDGQRAFDDVPAAIETLIRANEGIDCRVEPAMSFRDFLRARHMSAAEADVPHPAVVRDRHGRAGSEESRAGCLADLTFVAE